MSKKHTNIADTIFKVSGFLFLVGAGYILAYVVSGGLLEGILGGMGTNAFLTMVAFWVMIFSFVIKMNSKSHNSYKSKDPINIPSNKSKKYSTSPSKTDAGLKLVDIDGNKYNVAPFGNQLWMTENLNVSRFNNGDTIAQATSKEDWLHFGDNEEPAWCYYEFDESNEENYGKLYNGFTVFDRRQISPEGWHIPRDSDWMQLEIFLGMNDAEVSLNSIDIMKDAQNSGKKFYDERGSINKCGDLLKNLNEGAWSRPTGQVNNSSAALTSGWITSIGTFVGKDLAAWWTSSKNNGEIWYRSIGGTGIGRSPTNPYMGLSIRFIKSF